MIILLFITEVNEKTSIKNQMFRKMFRNFSRNWQTKPVLKVKNIKSELAILHQREME